MFFIPSITDTRQTQIQMQKEHKYNLQFKHKYKPKTLDKYEQRYVSHLFYLWHAADTTDLQMKAVGHQNSLSISKNNLPLSFLLLLKLRLICLTNTFWLFYHFRSGLCFLNFHWVLLVTVMDIDSIYINTNKMLRGMKISKYQNQFEESNSRISRCATDHDWN